MYSKTSIDKCRSRRDSGWFWSSVLLRNNYKKKIARTLKAKKVKVILKQPKQPKKEKVITLLPFDLEEYNAQPFCNFHYED